MPWVKGQSGNPRGRHTKARDRLTDRAIKALDADFRLHGAAAVSRCREENPAAYLAIVSKLFPKDSQVTHLHELSASFRSALLAAQHTSPSVTVINGSAETLVDEAKPLIALDTQRSKDIP